MPVVVEFSTIPEMFQKITAIFSSERRPSLMFKSEGGYKGLTYVEVRRQMELFACGLASLGLKRGERVAIVSENRPEWIICDQSIAALGAIDVPVYPTMTAKQIEYIFNDAGVRFAIVSNQFQLNKVIRVMDEVRTLERIILLTERGPINEPLTLGYSAILVRGKEFAEKNPQYLPASVASVRPDDLLTLIYTSGTTGTPKGVMLTHRNLCTNIISAATVITMRPDDVLLSFLPLSHSFERMGGYYTGFACGGTIAFAESVETVSENMLEVRPTIMTTVPRLFERIYSRVMKQVDSSPPLRRRIFHWAVAVGKEYAKGRRQHRVSPGLALRRRIADVLVFRKLKARTGGRMRFFVSGGAALAPEFGEFFEAVGLTIIEGYGLSETSPVLAANRLEDYRFGTVGKPIPGVELTIAADGEILARGPNIMKGYWNNPLATAEAIDEGGWLHTGDIGVLDAEGFLHITDRKKHIFVSSGGKNIAPQPIESLFLTSRYIEQFMLVGDRRMFLTALIVPDFDALKEYADAQNISYNDHAELARHEKINELIEQDIARIQKDLANYQRVRKFILLERQFSIEDGELTPTQKVRRKVIEERYAHLIDRMYAGVR